MCFDIRSRLLGCWGQNTSRIQNKEVYATLCLQAELEFYNFNFQPFTPRNIVAKPGDTLVTDCYYNTDGGVNFGIGTEDEMCIDFITYYPRGNLKAYCAFKDGNGVNTVTGTIIQELPRKFGVPKASVASTTAGPSSTTPSSTRP